MKTHSDYRPDNWVIVKIPSEVHGTYYKLLSGWSGGYLDGNSWRLNSGITEIEVNGDDYLVHGISGSTYECNKNCETIRQNIIGTANLLTSKEGVVIIPIEQYFEETKG